MTDVPFLARLGDAFDAAIATRAPQQPVLLRRRPAVRVASALVAALAFGVLLATPAVGVRGHIVRLFSDAPPAPKRVSRSFAALDEGTPPRFQTGVLAGQARKVIDVPVGFNTRAIVWLAPEKRGGFCSLLEIDRPDRARPDGVGGECTPLMDRLSVGTSLNGRISPTGEILSGPVLLDGWVGLPKADSLELRFQDGTAAVIPLVWVSSPISGGFFVYSIPPLHWRVGHLPTQLTVRSAEAKELAHAAVSGIDLRAAYAQP